MRKDRSVLVAAVARVETLERRSLLSTVASTPAASDTSGPDLTAALGRSGADHDAAWYKPVRRVSADASSDAAPVFSTNAAGLPLLTSRPDGVGLKIFLDFDGNGTNLPFGIDADDTTFNAAEQTAIYNTWRDIVSYYAMFNVNVTTIQPPTGGTNPLFAWHLTSKSISGGFATVNSLTRTAPTGFDEAGDAVSRTSGIAHEIGHILGLSHQGEWDRLGVNVTEYTEGIDTRDIPIMGVDYNTNIREWIYGRNSSGAANLQNDLSIMAAKVATVAGGDGYRPDDFGNTIATASPVSASVQQIPGIIERQTDADVFHFTVATAGNWHLEATPTFESSFAGKLELLDASGNLIAARDDTDQRNGDDNDEVIDLHLEAGDYYVRLSSSGDYSELGEYLMSISPLPNGFSSGDIDPLLIDRGGAAGYDPTSGILTQMASGTDITGTADQFRYTSGALTGDGSIIARVVSFDNTDASAKAGVMIRATTASNSAFAMIDVTPSGTVQFIRRVNSTTAASTLATATPGVLPRFLQLTRVGNNFSASYSADGVTWTALGATTSVTMNPTVRIGFASTSRSARKSAVAVFDNITLTGAIGDAAPTYNALPAPTDLVAAAAAGATTAIVLNWTAVADATGYAVERSVDGVVFTRLSSTLAAGVTTYTDTGLFGSMRWWYRVVALAADSTSSAPSSSTSVVNKPSAPTIPPAAYAVPAISPAAGTSIDLNWSDVQGDQGYRVERSTDGTTFTTLSVNTGTNLNGYNDTTALASRAYVYRITPLTNVGDGVAPSLLITAGTRWTTSNFAITTRASNSMVLGWTDFSTETGYRIERTLTGVTGWATVATLASGVTTWTDTNVTALGEYYYRIVAVLPIGELTSSSIAYAASLPATPLTGGWVDSDVGAVGGKGTAGAIGSTFKVIGAGTSIGTSPDTFHYLYKSFIGDGSIVVRVDSQKLNDIDDNAEAGIMIRSSLAADAPYAFVNVEPGRNGTTDFETRATSGAAVVNTAGVADRAPVWMRLTRVGNNFTGEYSTNGTTWTALATRAITMSTTAPIYIGMAVSAVETNLLSYAVFSNVTLTANLPPTVATAAAASTNPVTGTMVALSVLGADDKAETALTYTWTTIASPSGVTPPTFSVNASNAAKATVATFSAAGSYTFHVTIADAEGTSVTSDVNVTVVSTLATLLVSPSTASLNPGDSTQFSAAAKDQFGSSIATPTIAWSADRGSIDSNGLFLAPDDAGAAVITATAGFISGSATTTVRLLATTPVLDLSALPQSIHLAFNGDVGASLAASDFVITDLATSLPIASTSLAVAYDPATRFIAISYVPGQLPNGRYELTIQPGDITLSTGQPLSSGVTFDFGIFAGDITGDLKVDFDDLLVLAKHYNAPATNAEGDLTYDGVVNFDDLLALAKAYGTSLPPLASPTLAAASVTRRSRAASVIN